MCVVKGQFKATEHVTSAKTGTNQLARSGDSVFLHTHTRTHTHTQHTHTHFLVNALMHYSAVQTGTPRPVEGLTVACLVTATGTDQLH